MTCETVQKLKAKCGSGCIHLSQLAPKPSCEVLAGLRKGLRKRKVPKFECLSGEHPELGKFSISQRDGIKIIEWSVQGAAVHRVSLNDLNMKPVHEADRLEVGWLISHMYELDGLHMRMKIADPQEIMKTMSYFGRYVDQYRHWALVPAGHMKT